MTKMPRFGKMIHRVTINVEGRVADGGGGYALSWVLVVADEPAEVMPIGGSDQLFGDALQATVTHRVTLRYRSDVTPTSKHQVLFGCGCSIVAGWLGHDFRITNYNRA